MAITVNDVEYVAKLAKLTIADEEMDGYIKKLSAILDYMQQLQEIDTNGVPLTTHVLPLENIFRKDEVKPCLPREKVLANAPDTEDGYFKVPKIF